MSFKEVAAEVSELVEKKNQAYGDSFNLSSQILQILFPKGVEVTQYRDLLTITRIIDKLFRIANDKFAFNEDPWRDIMGYALLALTYQKEKKDQ